MKRWPFIRHLRFFYLSWRVHRWAQAWHHAGLGLGVLNESDIKHLDAIWEGRE